MTSLTDVLEPPHIAWHLYNDETPLAVVKFFERQIAILQHVDEYPKLVNELRRWRFHYGDRTTGKSWNTSDEGYIGLGCEVTTDTPGRVELALYKTRKTKQGRPILLASIVKIEATDSRYDMGRPAYRHPTFCVSTKVATHSEDTVQVETAQRRLRGIMIRRTRVV